MICGPVNPASPPSDPTCGLDGSFNDRANRRDPVQNGLSDGLTRSCRIFRRKRAVGHNLGNVLSDRKTDPTDTTEIRTALSVCYENESLAYKHQLIRSPLRTEMVCPLLYVVDPTRRGFSKLRRLVQDMEFDWLY